ncbi:MAG: hypothetical protein NXI32_14245 [bacterium]|nr:hypothetical protein [bacterium]
MMLLLALFAAIGHPTMAASQEPLPNAGEMAENLIRVDAFVRSDLPAAEQVATFARELEAKTPGLKVQVHDVLKDQEQLKRLYALSKKFGRERVVVPAFYACDRMYFGFADAAKSGPAIEELWTADVYTRDTCPRCQSAKAFIAQLTKRWPALKFRYYEITRDAAARRRWEDLARRSGQPPGLPTIEFARRVLIGYQGDSISGRQFENLIRQVAGKDSSGANATVESEPSEDANAGARPDSNDSSYWQRIHESENLRSLIPGKGEQLPAALMKTSQANLAAACLLCNHFPSTVLPFSVVTQQNAGVAAGAQSDAMAGQGEYLHRRLQEDVKDLPELPELPLVPGDSAHVEALQTNSGELPLDEDELPLDLALPAAAGAEDMGEAELSPAPLGTTKQSGDTIDLPVLGSLSASRVGLPAFTLAVGLVDGFNPCAMWILVFLLSVLVNIKDRWKILAVAGTFVVVSGVAYFAFMAAWLELFTLLGYVRPVQIALACLGIVIGVINIKDFFAFKKGISLSIPESSKPGLYKRVRQIVTAKYLSVAIAGAVTLAIIVNMVELLCTAGLPALYTQILTMQELPAWKNYLYLGLYIAAYMFDDMMLLSVVLVTLSHRKLQEQEGRWLKLISGLVVLVLALVMLFRPTWLQMGHPEM